MEVSSFNQICPVKQSEGTLCCSSVDASGLLYDFLVTVKAAPHECVIRTVRSTLDIDKS